MFYSISILKIFVQDKWPCSSLHRNWFSPRVEAKMTHLNDSNGEISTGGDEISGPLRWFQSRDLKTGEHSPRPACLSGSGVLVFGV